MTVYAYLRKDYPETLFLQMEKMKDYRCEDCLVETDSRTPHRELDEMLSNSKKGDKLIVSNLRVFLMTTKELAKLMNRLSEKKIQLISIDDGVDIFTSGDFGFILNVVVNMEKEVGRYKIKDKMVKASSKGKVWGRPQIDKEKIELMNFLYADNKLSMRQIAEKCEVSLGTVHKYVTKTPVI